MRTNIRFHLCVLLDADNNRFDIAAEYVYSFSRRYLIRNSLFSFHQGDSLFNKKNIV